MTEIAIRRQLADTIAEYDHKLKQIPNQLQAFEKAKTDLMTACTVNGVFGNVRINMDYVAECHLQESLLKSAWYNLYSYLQIDRIATAQDKKLFEQSMSNPPEFTFDNILASFGSFVADPYSNIIRGLAEVFCRLDDAYKSHDRVKIGVEGLPKRIILSGFSGWSRWGQDQLKDVLNALAAYQHKPFVTYHEVEYAAEKDGEVFLKDQVIKTKYNDLNIVYRGIRLKVFKNGNAHVFFEPDTLRDVNKALADFYGDVLPDCYEPKAEKKQSSTEVSKDLQYYPTPLNVVENVLGEIYIEKGDKILEPSCGCGRFLDALKAKGANVVGIEVDPTRAQICKSKGHKVQVANFLETVPTPIYDKVIMNPPFYGKHYAKHIEHALKFLKPGGILVSILPCTARYDHGLITEGSWRDLPLGSFSESGTNINTCVLTIRKR